MGTDDMLREAHIANIPEGYPGSQKDTIQDIQDGSKATRVLGLKYTDRKTTIIDAAESILARFPALRTILTEN